MKKVLVEKYRKYIDSNIEENGKNNLMENNY